MKMSLFTFSNIYLCSDIGYYFCKPFLKRLHWPPIASRIDLKIATLIYTVHLKPPPSLAELLKFRSMHLNALNNDQLLLQHPPVGTNNYGSRALRYTSAQIRRYKSLIV